jgi:uncharacterized protein (TIGR03083 family)
MEHWETITAERQALADTLDGLTPDQWATRSLCSEWTVHQVTAHLIVTLRNGLRSFFPAFVAARGNFHRANAALATRAATRPPDELVADLRNYADSHFKPPGLGSVAPLTEVLVHGRDIRVPLGIAEDRPIEPWRDALDFLVTPKARRGFTGRSLPSLHYVATDLNWSHGSGDEVLAPAVAMALAMVGRTAMLDDLEGPGAGVLRGWAGG